MDDFLRHLKWESFIFSYYIMMLMFVLLASGTSIAFGHYNDKYNYVFNFLVISRSFDCYYASRISKEVQPKKWNPATAKKRYIRKLLRKITGTLILVVIFIKTNNMEGSSTIASVWVKTEIVAFFCEMIFFEGISRLLQTSE